MRFVGIDPATCTGFVALNEAGEVLVEQELGKAVKGGLTIPQLVTLENHLYKLLEPEDVIMFESPGMATQKAITTGMIHGGLRSIVYRKGMTFGEVAPGQVKKYVGVTGWKGDKGSMKRLEGREKKAAIEAAVLEHYGYTHDSDNVIDAYIIAKISRDLYLIENGGVPSFYLRPYQNEVLKTLLA